MADKGKNDFIVEVKVGYTTHKIAVRNMKTEEDAKAHVERLQKLGPKVMLQGTIEKAYARPANQPVKRPAELEGKTIEYVDPNAPPAVADHVV